MASASAGKIGFCSSGMTSPTRRARSPRSFVGRSYPSTSSAVSTASRVDADTPGLPFSTRLTVASLTPTLRATSASLLDMPAMLRECTQELDSAATEPTSRCVKALPVRRGQSEHQEEEALRPTPVEGTGRERGAT
jgi:hypothetical protein